MGACALLAWVLCSLFVPRLRWRMRHYQGPKFRMLVGQIPEMLQIGSYRLYYELAKVYGPVYQVWLGKNPLIVVVDPDIGRVVMNRLLNRLPPPPSLFTGDIGAMNAASILFARDNYWRTLRNAWTPAFAPSSLEGYMKAMNESATKLRARLLALAKEGQPVDIWRELGNMTLQAVGTSAYGVDFHLLDDDVAPEDSIGARIAEATRTYLLRVSIRGASRYGRAMQVLPDVLRPLVRTLAHLLPDTPFRELRQSRRVTLESVFQLINAWRAVNAPKPADGGLDAAPDKSSATALDGTAKAAGEVSDALNGAAKADGEAQAATNGAATNGSAIGAANGAANGTAGGAVKHSGTGRKAGVTGVEPGSFLNLMMDARVKGTETRLDDLQIAGQVDIFLMAGYETTANGLAFTVYLLATNPDKERRMLEEIDAFGRDREVTHADLEKFPYASAVFDEALRLYPPAHTTARYTSEEMEVGGWKIPARTGIMIAIWAIQRDAKYWPRPEEFLPERWLPGNEDIACRNPNAYIPFGGGPRKCIGYRFALQEAVVALVTLYQRMCFRLTAGQQPLQLAAGITLQPKTGLQVTLHLREEQ